MGEVFGEIEEPITGPLPPDQPPKPVPAPEPADTSDPHITPLDDIEDAKWLAEDDPRRKAVEEFKQGVH